VEVPRGREDTPSTSSAEAVFCRMTDLPDELLNHIFSKLDYRTLARVEQCCSRFRQNVRWGQLWKKLCTSEFRCLSKFLQSQYGLLVSSNGHGGSGGIGSINCNNYEAHQSHLMKTLVAKIFLAVEEANETSGGTEGCDSVANPNRGESEDDPTKRAKQMLPTSLIVGAVEATSTDHPEESIGNVLSLETRVLSSFFKLCYWSSKGSESPMASEALVFKLSHFLTVVNAVQIRPFEAHFQRGSPIYAPLFVRFSFGELGACETHDLSKDDELAAELSEEDEEDEDEERDLWTTDRHHHRQKKKKGSDDLWKWRSKLYPMEQVNALQTFRFPPTLCCGGYVKIELLGRTQRQEIDNLYYLCLSHVKVLGRPVEGFTDASDDSSDVLGMSSAEVGSPEPTLVYHHH